jgi:hypothetical protein
MRFGKQYIPVVLSFGSSLCTLDGLASRPFESWSHSIWTLWPPETPFVGIFPLIRRNAFSKGKTPAMPSEAHNNSTNLLKRVLIKLKYSTESSRCVQASPVDWSDALSKVPLHVVKPETCFDRVLELLAEHSLHRVYVLDDTEDTIGIITLTDILRQLLPHVRPPNATEVSVYGHKKICIHSHSFSTVFSAIFSVRPCDCTQTLLWFLLSVIL